MHVRAEAHALDELIRDVFRIDDRFIDGKIAGRKSFMNTAKLV
jgi:hypothetical protein